MLKLADILNYLKERTREPKVLWSGAYYMNAAQTINLPEDISKQPNGIVLVFSTFDQKSQTANDWGYTNFFVSKKFVSIHPGRASYFNMTTEIFSRICAKVLTISAKTITGNNNNTKAETARGVSYDNKDFVLRYVIGV